VSSINPFGQSFLNSLFQTNGQTPNVLQTLEAEILKLPQAIQKPTLASVLKGSIVAKAKEDHAYIFQTPKGDVILKIPSPLPIGTKGVLNVPPMNQPAQTAQLQIISIPQPPNPAPQTTPSNTISSQKIDISQSQALQKTIQTAQQSGSTTTMSSSGLQVGQIVRLTSIQDKAVDEKPVNVPAVQPKNTGKGAKPTPESTLSPPPSPSVQPQNVPQNNQTVTPINNGSFNAKIIQILPVQSPLPEQKQSLLPQKLPQSITMDVSAFQGVEKTPVLTLSHTTQTYTLSTPLPQTPILNIGDKIILAPTQAMQTEPLTGTILPQPSSSMIWPEMKDLFLFMAQSGGVDIGRSLLQILPNVAQPKSFPVVAVMFLAAAHNGDLSAWTGTALNQIIKNLPLPVRDMAESLLNDAVEQNSAPSRLTAESPISQTPQTTSDWRALLLPFLFDADVYKLPLYVRDESYEENNEIYKGKRFVIDLNLSQMGNIQMDGLYRPIFHRVDMVMITEHDLSTRMTDKINSIWTKTMLASNMQGTIRFQKFES